MTTMITRAVPTHGRRQRCVQRGRSRRTSVRVTLGAVVAAALAALVGGAGSPAWAGTPTVQVETNATFGAILASSSAMALYTLNTDHNGQSTCHGSCATAWPALTVPAGTVAIGGPGVTGTVGTATQSNGTTQVTYNGSPLYTFVGDVAPGQVTGNNVSGFFVVTAGLTTSTTTPGPTPAPTGTAPPFGGVDLAVGRRHTKRQLGGGGRSRLHGGRGRTAVASPAGASPPGDGCRDHIRRHRTHRTRRTRRCAVREARLTLS